MYLLCFALQEVECLQKDLHISDRNDVVKYNTLLLEEEAEAREQLNVRALSTDVSARGHTLSSVNRRHSSNAAIKMVTYTNTYHLVLV